MPASPLCGGLSATRQDLNAHSSFVKEHTLAFVGPSVGELMACCVSPHSAQSLVFKWHLSAFWCLALCSPAIRKDTLRVPDRCLVTSVRSCFSSTRTGGPHTFLLWNIIIKMDSTLWGLSLAVIKTYKCKKVGWCAKHQYCTNCDVVSGWWEHSDACFRL